MKIDINELIDTLALRGELTGEMEADSKDIICAIKDAEKEKLRTTHSNGMGID